MMNRSLNRCTVFAVALMTVAFGASAMAATHEVDVANFAFAPANVDAAPGDTIHWTWSSGTHSVTSGAVCGVTGDGRFDSGVQVGPDFTWVVPSNEPDGVIPYYCIPHCAGGMTATITVEGATGIPTMSEWGVAVMALLVLTAGTAAFSLRRRVATVRA